jgi:hypothetical protein
MSELAERMSAWARFACGEKANIVLEYRSTTGDILERYSFISKYQRLSS